VNAKSDPSIRLVAHRSETLPHFAGSSDDLNGGERLSGSRCLFLDGALEMVFNLCQVPYRRGISMTVRAGLIGIDLFLMAGAVPSASVFPTEPCGSIPGPTRSCSGRK
jgi:hypothetical protein